MVLVPEIEPQPAVARRLADHRQHVRQARPRAHPRFGIDSVSQWKQFVRLRQYALELDRRGGRIAPGKLDAGRDAYAATQRRQQITETPIENRMTEARVARRRQDPA